MKPRLLTFDIFGTVLDWRLGLAESVRSRGFPFNEATDFDSVIDAQAEDEQTSYESYSNIVARSLEKVIGIETENARAIGLSVGEWPLFSDSKEALKRLMTFAPCVAMTNSDFSHGKQVQRQLGFELSEWICAEEVKVYKPSPNFWQQVSNKMGIPMDGSWWHVAAYGDYDLTVARELGLTCVFINRPHAVDGPADLRFENLRGLADHVSSLF